jgi:hypothetical protein
MFSAAAAAAVAAPASSGTARADQIEVCASAAMTAQRLQRDGRLQSARQALVTCSGPGCPNEVRALCDDLFSRIDASQPTLILGARDEQGRDIVAAAVYVDNVRVADSLDGRAILLDPGPHTLRFERAGSPPVEESIVLREGQKNRSLVVVVPGPTLVASSSSPIPTASYVLGAIGILGLGVFAALAVDGQSRYDACNPHGCSQSTVDHIATERDVTFGVLGVGVVSLAAAAWWFFFARPTHRASLGVGVTGVPGGGVAALAGSFP